MKRKILLRLFALVAATMCALGMQAAALAYACYTSSDKTLTFYYDDSSHSGTRFSLNTGTATPGWSNFASSIQKVVFDPSFAGASPTSTFSWFAGMSNLTTIDGITYLNTSEVTNMASMFSNCSSLTSLNVTNFYTVNVTNMSWMFEGCSGLTHLNVSSFSTSKVTRMTKMFYGCSGLTDLSLYGFNTSRVTDMSYMFYGCSGLRSLNLITITTDNVTNMRGMFGNCSRLTGLGSFSGVNTSQVTDMSYMFNNCTNLSTLDLSDFNTANVIDMSGMFMGCEGLTSLNVSSFNTSNVTNMSYMFDNCYALTTLDLSHFNTSNVTDMKYMFAVSSSGVNTNNLTTITVGESWSTAAVTSSDNMFWKCTNLVGGMGTTYSSSHINKEYAHIDGGTSNPGYLTDGREAYACYTSSNTTLTFYYDTRRASYPAAVTYSMNSGTYIPGWHSIASSITRVVFDSSFANARPESTCRWFSGMTNLQSITGMQYYLNTSNVTNMNYMFDDCIGLTSIRLSGFNTDKVTSMSGMFCGCSGLTSLNLSAFNTANVTAMVNMFYGCSGLTSLNLSAFNTANVTTMVSMFYGCSGLTSLNLSAFNTANVTSMENMFYGCSGLVSLNVSNFNTANVTEMGHMFDGCSGLTSLDLSSFNTAKVTGMGYMFDNCSGLTSLDLTDFNTAKVADMRYMFYRCSNLVTIYVGSGWSTGIVTRSDNMFYDCTSLVGSMGTTYSSSHINKEYAHIDGGPSNPGYLSERIPEAYACYTPSNTTLRFYFDTQRSTRTGTTYDLNTGNISPVWYTDGTRGSVTRVVFDASFANARPTTAFSWFNGMTNLQTISGMSYLNTSQVTNMENMFYECSNLTSLDLSGFNTNQVTSIYGMFYGCSSLTTLDLSSFNTANVTNMNTVFCDCSSLTSLDLSSFNTANTTRMMNLFNGCSGLTTLDLGNFNTANVTSMFRMFNECSNLTTVYVADGWSTEAVTNSTGMFTDCVKLVGGRGTTYSVAHLDKSYAHIDGGTSNPGYFTDRNTVGQPEAYACYTSENTTLTFYFDTLRLSRPGTIYDLNTGTENPAWSSYAYLFITQVVFDPAFAGARPTSTYKWFYLMTNLETITGLQYLNTTNVTNMSNMFRNCYKLTSLDVSNFNTANVTNMSEVFSGCSGVTRLDVSNFNTALVTNMSGMFTDCSGLTSLDVSNFNTANVTNMIRMFSHDSGLTSLDLRSFNTASVTNMDYMLYNCSSLTSLDVSSFNTANVTDMRHMFYNCSSLTSLDLSSFNTASVTYTGGMFNKCSNLRTIFAGDGWSTAAVTYSGNMFTDCTSLVGGMGTTYDAAHVDAAYAHIDGGTNNPGYFTAEGAEPWTEPEAYACYTPSNTTLTFYYDGQRSTRAGTTYDLNEGQNNPGWYSDGTNSSVTSVEFDPSFAYARPTTACAWFFGMSNLESITGLDYLNTTDVTKMNNMFRGCSKLTSLDVTGFNTANVTTMYFMFYDCYGLTSLDVSDFNTSNVTNMGYMFSGCSKLTSLDVSSFNTASVTQMMYMFAGCSMLATIYAGDEWSTAAVTSSNYMFRGSMSLVGGMGTTYDANHVDKAYAHIDGGPNNPGYFTAEGAAPWTDPEAYACYTSSNTTLTFYYDPWRSTREGMTYDLNTGQNNPGWYSDGTNSSVTSVVFDPSFAYARPTTTCAWFFGMSNLESISGLDYLNTTDVTQMNNMFRGCSSLTSLDVTGFNTANVTTMYFMFYDCYGLTSLDVSGFNTANVTNMGYMFSGCSKLTSLDVSSFNTAGVFQMTYMFYGCSRLGTIYAGDEWSTTAVTSSNNMFRGCTSLVGGQGTTFDANHVDKAYAHIDGGPSNPGYFTEKVESLPGDANGDGVVNITDATALIMALLNEDFSNIIESNADMNGDGSINITDATVLISQLLNN